MEPTVHFLPVSNTPQLQIRQTQAQQPRLSVLPLHAPQADIYFGAQRSGAPSASFVSKAALLFLLFPLGVLTAATGALRHAPRQETGIERTIQIAEEKLKTLKEKQQRQQLLQSQKRQLALAARIKHLEELINTVKNQRGHEPGSREFLKAINSLRAALNADPSVLSRTKWSPQTVRLTACSQDQTAGFFKYVNPLCDSLDKTTTRTLYQALCEIQSQEQGEQDRLASSNMYEMADVWNKDENEMQRDNRKVLILFHSQSDFKPEIKKFIANMVKNYQLSLGNKTQAEIDEAIEAEKSLDFGNFILICPKRERGKEQIIEAFDKLQQFKKAKGDNAEALIYIDAHGGKDGLEPGMEDQEPLEGSHFGTTYFEGFEVNKQFWIDQSQKLNDYQKYKVPIIFDTCHSATMIALLNDAKERRSDVA